MFWTLTWAFVVILFSFGFGVQNCRKAVRFDTDDPCAVGGIFLQIEEMEEKVPPDDNTREAPTVSPKSLVISGAKNEPSGHDEVLLLK